MNNEGQLDLFEQEKGIEKIVRSNISPFSIDDDERATKVLWERYGEELGEIVLINYPVPAKDTLGMLRKKLIELNIKDFEIKKYSKMTDPEAEEYLNHDLRPFFRCQLAKYNHPVLMVIDKRNKEEYDKYSKGHTLRA